MKLSQLRLEIERLLKVRFLDVDGDVLPCTTESIREHMDNDVKWIEENKIYLTEEPHVGDCYYKMRISIADIGYMVCEIWGNEEAYDDLVKDVLGMFSEWVHKRMLIDITNMFGRGYTYDRTDIAILKEGTKIH